VAGEAGALATEVKRCAQEVEWEIPRDTDKSWPEPASRLHADWWEARIARQKEIDASIAAKA
jgi:adenine-specific DNA-methyltransferase